MSTSPPAAPPRPTLRFRLLATVVVTFVRLMRWRVTTEGLDHVPRRGGAVITWNHHSHVDFLVTMWDVYRRLGRPVRYLAADWIYRSPRLGWIPRLADAVPVERDSHTGRGRALDAAVTSLRAGHLVMVAPEGTVSPSFELLPFRTGAARMAQAAGVTIVPSVSWGSQRLSTTGHPLRLRRAYRIPVTVRFGAPLAVAADEDARTVTARLQAQVDALLDDVQRGYPDGAPAKAWWVPHRLGGGAPPHDEVLAAHRGRHGILRGRWRDRLARDDDT